MISELNLSFDVNEALAYYETLNNDYKHLHWFYLKDHNDPKFIDPKNKMDDMNGWGLQTIYNDMSFPYHCDLDPHNEGPKYFKSTPLVFGFAERLLNFFPSPYRTCLYIHTPTTHINKWMPGGPKHVKVILPLRTNSKSLLTSHTMPVTEVHPVPGKVYLVKPTNPIEVINLGETDDIFIVFNVPEERLSDVEKLTGVI